MLTFQWRRTTPNPPCPRLLHSIVITSASGLLGALGPLLCAVGSSSASPFPLRNCSTLLMYVGDAKSRCGTSIWNVMSVCRLMLILLRFINIRDPPDDPVQVAVAEISLAVVYDPSPIPGAKIAHDGAVQSILEGFEGQGEVASAEASYVRGEEDVALVGVGAEHQPQRRTGALTES